MNRFIDLVGASGVTYRFLLVEGVPPPPGGNFVYVRDEDGARRVVCCGKARTLAWGLTKHVWAEDELGRQGDQLYVRLNFSAKTRATEHDDVVAGLSRPFAIYEID